MDTYIEDDYCSGWQEIALDIFVVVKAAIILLVCARGIYWFFANKFNHITVVMTLIISSTMVVCEMIYRFSNRRLSQRFLLNAFSQWLVFLTFTVMLGFARKNDAAQFRIPLRRTVFVPLHCCYLTIIIVALVKQDYIGCESRPYPQLFDIQYGLFYATYFLFLFLHKNDYFLQWHPDIAQLDFLHP